MDGKACELGAFVLVPSCCWMPPDQPHVENLNTPQHAACLQKKKQSNKLCMHK
jgi:hypothetical protein